MYSYLGLFGMTLARVHRGMQYVSFGASRVGWDPPSPVNIKILLYPYHSALGSLGRAGR